MKTALFTRGRDRLQVRAGDPQQPATIRGYGAVFYNPEVPGSEYKLFDDMVERIMPGAFDRALQEDDVRSLFNHDPNYLLGRNKSGTLRLSVDAVGLLYEVDPPASRADVVDSVQRGDVDGSSFMFEITDVAWREEARDEKTLIIREIRDVQLWEVGPVVFPAYEASTAGLRNRYLEALREERSSRVRPSGLSPQCRRAVELRARSVAVRERSRPH